MLSYEKVAALQKVRDELLQRARGFFLHPGIFNGRLVGEELSFWVKRMDEVLNK